MKWTRNGKSNAIMVNGLFYLPCAKTFTVETLLEDANLGAEADAWEKAGRAMKAAIEADRDRGGGQYGSSDSFHKDNLKALALCPSDEADDRIEAAQQDIRAAEAKLADAKAKLKEAAQ